MWESRVAPLTGVLFGLLLAASFVVDSNTDFMPPASEVVTYLEGRALRIISGAYLRLLAAAALLWFSASLYRSTRVLDDDNGRLSVLSFGGGVFAAALIAAGATAMVTAAERMWVVGEIDAGAATALYDLAGIAIGNGAPLGLGVMILATAAARLRADRGNLWVGWAGIGIGVGLLSPFAWVMLALALVWVPATGISIYRDQAALAPSEVS